MTSLAARGLFAAGVSFSTTPIALAVLRRRDVLDHPNERSSHDRPVPRGGGVAPAVALLVALALTPSFAAATRWALTLGSAGVGLLGLVEDINGIPALRRLTFQFAVSAIAALFLLRHLDTPLPWKIWLAVVTVVWLVAFVNAFNFMDGIDGISVVQAVAAGTTWLLIGSHAHSTPFAAGGALVAGAALGFAPYNLRNARIFLGDVGSYFLGAWLATVVVVGLRAGVQPEAVLAPLALYLADTGTTLIRRVARREAWYQPHRDHAYQRLSHAGWSHARTSGVVGLCIGACCGLGAVSMSHSFPARVGADLAILVVLAGYLSAPRWLIHADDAKAV